MTVLALRRRTHVERKVLLILRGDDSGWPQIWRGSRDGANTVVVPTILPDRFQLDAVKNIVDAKPDFERRQPFPDVGLIRPEQSPGIAAFNRFRMEDCSGNCSPS